MTTVLLIYYWITNYHKLCNLMQRTFTIWVSWFRSPGIKQPLPSLSEPHKAAINVSYCCVLEPSVLFQANVVVGRIQFHLVVGSKSPFSCRLSAREQPQLPDATSNSFPLKGPLTAW